MLKLAFVVQRYGSQVSGTVESLARELAERAHMMGVDVTVFTTTAQNEQSWENQFPVGESILRGVRILRHRVQKNCDTESFKRINQRFFSRSPEERDDPEWLQMRNPDSPDMMASLARMEDEFDLFVFFSCLDRSTLEGVFCIRKKPVVLFPVVQALWQLQFPLVQDLIRDVETLFFLSLSEQEAVQKHRPEKKPAHLLRYGIQSQFASKELMRHKYGLILPYMLYAGRIEAGKELEPVFEAYRELRNRRLLNWVLIGRQMMDLPREEGIISLGYLSETEKRSAMAGALFTVHSASDETISSTVLESFSQSVPILASDRSPVFREYSQLGRGGLLYRHAGEFIEKAEYLVDNLDQRRLMGRQGRLFVENCHSWNGVMDQFVEQMKRIANHDC